MPTGCREAPPEVRGHRLSLSACFPDGKLTEEPGGSDLCLQVTATTLGDP